MKTVLLALALAAGFAGASYAQQMDGKNCDFAYKKLQQHRTNGSCFEQGDHKDNKDSAEPTGNGEHSIRDKVEHFFDRASGF